MQLAASISQDPSVPAYRARQGYGRQELRHRVPYRVRREAASARWYAEAFLHRHTPASSSECADALTAGSSLKTAFVRVMAAD